MISDEKIKRIAAQTEVAYLVTNGDMTFDDMRNFARAIYELGRADQRESDARLCERNNERMKQTELAHYRLSPEPFRPEAYGFDQFRMRDEREFAAAIRANTGDITK